MSRYMSQYMSQYMTTPCRYLLHLPGNSYSGRLKYLLACGAAVVWLGGDTNATLASHWQEFWYHLLQVSTPVWILV